MGNSLRLLKAALVRALLLPVPLALAWIIWGAASAGAASGDTATAGPLGTGSLSTGSLSSGPLKTAPVAAVALPAAVTKPLSPVVGTVADTAGTVVNGASTAVSTVTTTVTTTAAPVLGKADNLISAAEDIIASVPPLPALPAAPVPAVPVPSLPVPSVPAPSVPVTPVPGPLPTPSVPVPSVPAQELPSAPVPGVTRTAQDPGAAGNQPNPASASHAVSPSAVKPASKTAGGAVQPTGAALPLAGPGLSLAVLRMTTPEQRELAAVRPATHDLHFHEWPGGGLLHPFAVSEGTSGNSSPGFEGSGAQAAEVAGGWDRVLVLADARAIDAGQHLPTSPAFDPGCSPD